MTYLEVGLESQAVSLAGDPNRVVAVDYGFVTRATEIALDVSRNTTATANEKQLADAVFALANVLTDIVSGLDHGRMTVHNYPIEEAHLN